LLQRWVYGCHILTFLSQIQSTIRIKFAPMLSEKVVTALSEQIALESNASAQYLAIATWMTQQGFAGASAFFFRQSDEERMHMLRIVHYLLDQEATVHIPAVKEPSGGFNSFPECFKFVLEAELAVTRSIHELVELAMQERDYATHHFLQWYVSEQMEEEKQIKGILDKLRIIGNDGSGLYLLDRELETLAAAPVAPPSAEA
jgi:ferritin